MTTTRPKMSPVDHLILKRIAKAPCYVQALQAGKPRIGPLVAAGLIERFASDTNMRAKNMVRITARGVDALERLA